jgi:hypothetical protein
LSLNREFPFINLETNTICTPYMQNWDANKVRILFPDSPVPRTPRPGLGPTLRLLRHLSALPHVSFSSLSPSAPTVLSTASSLLDCTFLIPPSAYQKLRKLGSGACGNVYEG